MSWNETGEAYAASYAGLCAGTHEQLRLLLGAAHGRTLLDVGAGTGALCAGLAEEGWDVTAVEPEESMRRVSRTRYPMLSVVDAAFPALPFGTGQFDAVVANFVLNHVPDPRAAAAEMRRVSADTLIATIWSESPVWLWAEVTACSGLPPSAGQRLPPERDFERTPDGFAGMLAESGWKPEVAELRWEWETRPEVLWASVEGGIAGAGAFYRGLGAEERSRFRSAFDRVMAERESGGIVVLAHAAAVGWSRAL